MIDLASLGKERLKRLSAFRITQSDLAVLDRHRDRLLAMLPDILAGSAEQMEIWPKLRVAVAIPDVAQARAAHWKRTMTGDIGEGYRESAIGLANAFLRHGIPAHAASFCHAMVLRFLAEQLGAEAAAAGWGRRRSARMTAHALHHTVSRLAWLDLGLILATYADGEQAVRAAARSELEVFQVKAQVVVQAVGSGSAAVENSARTVARIVEETGERAAAANSASDEASANVLSVAGAAEQLSALISEIANQAGRAAEIARRPADALPHSSDRRLLGFKVRAIRMLPWSEHADESAGSP